MNFLLVGSGDALSWPAYNKTQWYSSWSWIVYRRIKENKMLSDLISVWFSTEIRPCKQNRIKRKSSFVAVRCDSEYSDLHHYIYVIGNPIEFSCATWSRMSSCNCQLCLNSFSFHYLLLWSQIKACMFCMLYAKGVLRNENDVFTKVIFSVELFSSYLMMFY